MSNNNLYKLILIIDWHIIEIGSNFINYHIYILIKFNNLNEIIIK